MSVAADHAALQGQCPRRARRRSACKARCRTRAISSAARAAAVGAAAGIRRAARQRARDQGPHARPSRSLSRSLRAQGHRGGRPRALRARRRRSDRDHPRPLPGARRQDGRPRASRWSPRRSASTRRSRRRGSRRSRPISANTSSSCAARRPRTSSPRPSMSPATTSRPTSAAPPRSPAGPRPFAARATARRGARDSARQAFLSADVGVTGANFLVAETGTSIIVTNEGNGDLTQTLPKVHVVARLDREARRRRSTTPRRSCACSARSATGQDMSVYTTLSTGPRRAGRPRRAGGISRRPARQRPLGDARRASSPTCCAASAAAPA